MRVAGLFLCLVFLLTAPLAAQEQYPIPDDLQSITPGNADQLQPLASIGGILPGGLVWSPDGALLAVGTLVDVRLYNASDFESSPLVIPDYGETIFNAAGELMVNGQRYDTQTGELLGASQVLPAAPITSPSGNIVVRMRQQDGHLVVELDKTDGEVILLHPGAGYDFKQIVFSPDEQFAALILTFYPAASPSAAVQLWNVQAGDLVADLPLSLEVLDTIAFHADGKLLVTAVTTNAPYGGIFADVQLWDGRTGENIGPSNYSYLPVRFSPDGQLLAFMTSQGIALWTDHEIGLLQFTSYSEAGLVPIVFSPDGGTIATVSGQEILLWDVNSKQPPDAPRKTLTTEAGIIDLLYSPDGTLLASIEAGGIIEVWNTQIDAPHTRLSAADQISDVQFSPDGRLLRVSVYGGHRSIWDLQSGEKKVTFPRGAALNNDWSRVAYWDDSIVRLMETDTGQETELAVLSTFLGNVAAFSPTAERVIFAGSELRMYDLHDGEQVFSEPIGERLPWVEFSMNGDRFVTGVSPAVYGRGDPLTLNVRDTQNPQSIIARLEIPNGGRNWLLSPDGHYLSYLNMACGDGGGGYHELWDAETAHLLSIWSPGGTCGPYTHVFSPDGLLLLVGWDFDVGILDIDRLIEEAASVDNDYLWTPAKEGGIFYYPGNQLDNLTLSSDGSRLAITIATYTQFGEGKPEENYRVEVFQIPDASAHVENETLLETAVRIPDARWVTFSPDNQWLLTDNGFWNAVTGNQLAHVSSRIAAFSPDGAVLSTVIENGVALWDVSALAQGSELPEARINFEGVQALAFSPDGKLLYMRRVGDVQVWGIPVAIPE